jgi:Flp pilus assembly protein TadD
LAADSFSAVTKLRPDSVDAWLELTWALASLERFDEAESSARQAVALVPDSVETLGNLASALLQRDNLDEALVTINRALEIDPSDATNQLILERIREAQALVASAPRLPWYRRLWGK